MQPELYFQLLTPVLFLGVALLFAIIARKNPEYTETRLFAASYFFGALGFFVDFFRTTLPMGIAATSINTFYLLTTVCFTIALVKRSGLRVPMPALCLALVLYTVAHFFFSFVHYDLWLLTTSLSIIHGSLFALGFAIVWTRLSTRIEQALKWMGVLFSARFFIQPFLAKTGDMFPETYEAYSQSNFLLIALLIIGINALGVAFTLIADYTLKILQGFRKDAQTDRLSGLLNRRGFDRAAGELFNSIQIKDKAIFAIMVDIDHFKTLNDAHGHAFGDEVIVQLGRLLGTIHHEESIAARLGGEEFAVLLTGADMDAAVEKAESLRKALAALRLYSVQGPVSFTASLGVAQYIPSEPLPDLIARADRALYWAKGNGRNCVGSQVDASIESLRKISGASVPKANLLSNG